MTALAWFRRDLRLHDNPALRAALRGGRDDRWEARRLALERNDV